MKYILALMLSIITFLGVYAQEIEYNNLVLSQSKNSIQLEKDLSYYYLTASNSYLAWYEGFTNQVYYQNLTNGKISKINPKKGRGPFEILSIRGLAIRKNHLIFLDSQNNKIVRYDMDKSEFVNEFVTGRYRIQFLTSSFEQVYGKAINRKAIYFEIDPSKEEIKPLEKSFAEDFARAMNKNIFRFEGPFLANSEYIISVRTYEPSMFVFNLGTELIDFEYDETKSKPEYVYNEFGFASNPPAEVNMVLKDAALKPNSNIIYLARNGYTEKYPKNNRSVLYQYDYVKKEYVGILETGIESIGKIVTNDKYLFVYDDKNFTITKIEQ